MDASESWSPVDERRGWDYLQRLGNSARVPRPQHATVDRAEQEALKKLPDEVEAIRQAHPSSRVEL